jgi:hypothetical protein
MGVEHISQPLTAVMARLQEAYMGNKFARGSDSGPRELVPARSYVGIITGVFDLGYQPGFQGGPSENKFLIVWELHLPATRKRGPKPAINERGEVYRISQFVAVKLGSRNMPSNLLKIIEATDGVPWSEKAIKEDSFDMEALLDQCATVIVAHRGEGEKARSIIETVTALDDEADDKPTAQGDSHYFELTPEVLKSRDLPTWLPRFVARLIGESLDWRGIHGTAKPDEDRRRLQPADPRAVAAAMAENAARNAEADDDDDDDDIPF